MAPTLNMNEFAEQVTLQEGKKVSLPIGQVKEVIRLTMVKLAGMPESDLLKLVRRYR